MISKVYSLRDIKANVFGRPVFTASLGLLVRELQDALRGDDMLAKHPEDFALFELGEFDDSSASFTLLPHPVLVLEVNSLVQAVA